ncbi:MULTISPECIES: non-ribosomal peptide synthetase [unclassified Streptomyces]|uniref:non-ribosomal peptide synthetase n=1 Tax=unclassified Streptomyces TaxID=2593676 RepID=UPI002259C349|nr:MULTISPECIES: non-ribosomal peptide synthetase [unclassified Streptomyces]MCX4870453.1 amino acid adenylation domain-containing protein [Streptomyces sp. NBC_00906]MCX4902070.1 amino acid adenylation domain-containing protein [Streptomyces sp. NBC_00892]
MTAPTAPTQPTQEELRAELLRRRLAGRGAGTSARTASIPRADRTKPLELSAGQRQLWFLHQLDPESPEYLLPMAYRLRGPLSPGTLQQAFDSLAARHEILRTRYVLDAADPRQVVDPAGPVDLAVTDRPGLDAAARDAAAVAFTEARAAETFDLAADHPLRVRLLRFAPDDHVLLVVMHHIACDALTRPLLLADLAALYRGEELPELPVQYADYAAWAARRQSGPDADRGLDRWRRELAGVEPLALPTDRPRPAVRTWGGATHGFDVPATTATALRKVARDGDATLFMVLLTAYQTLLGRYTGKRDVSVGTAVSGRTRPELRQMAGYAYNTLVLRGRWSADPAFRDVLAANRTTVLDAFDHQETPFDRIADELEPERDLSTTPLFQVMFDLASGEGADGPGLPGITAEPVPAASSIARFDLTLHLTERADGTLHGSLEYATALFDAATAARIAGHYPRLLAQIAATPDAPLSTLDPIGPEERALLLDGPATPVGTDHPLDATALRPVLEAILEQAAATPDATALRHGDTTYTYRRLAEESEQYARRLAGLGIGPEDTVAVLLDRSPRLVAALLGIWRAGAAYVPVDPGYPDERVGHMLATTGTRTVLTETRYADRFDGPAVLVADEDGSTALDMDEDGSTALDMDEDGSTALDMDEDGSTALDMDEDGSAAPADADGLTVLVADDPAEQAARAAATAALPTGYDLDALAYVIYTSGSTGRPKGVLVTHRGLANYLGWTVQAYADAGPGGAPLFSSVAFDLGVPDLYAPLMTGRDVHLLPQDFDTADLGALLAAGAPYAFIKLTPGHLDLLQQQLTDEQIRNLAGLVIAAGDSFTARLAERWTTSAGPDGTRLAAEYGPTEITVGNSAYFLDGPVTTELVPIGRAVPHTTMYVLDEQLRPLPVGVPGEVWIGGIGVARGYAGRPDLTAERFVPDPYGPAGTRLYRTGDIARVLPDGNLDFVARADHQVKLRGYRIEPGEIEAALTADPAVAEAVALVREDSPGAKELVAYVVPAEGADPDDLTPAALRARVGETLPPYMVPAAYLTLDALPLTANGKLDRRALPAPGRAATAVGDYVEARDATEGAIAAIWATVLGRDTVGVHDNFFELGGDSIRAVTLVGALREAGWETSVRDIFAHRTVARLRTALGDADGADGAGPGNTVARFALIGEQDRAALPADVTDAYPVSLTQAGMLVEMYGESTENRYHNITSFRIRDELPFDPEAFQRAADLIVERHEVMRTSFALDGYSRPLQLVHAASRMPCVFDDLRHLPAARRELALWEFADRDREELFDLTRAPLMRMAVHLLDDESWWLSITECHPVIEGWSYHSQLMEMLRAYRALRSGAEPETAPPVPAVRYADFVAGELRSLEDPADRDHWRHIVDTYERFSVPAGWQGDDEGDERYRIDVPLGDVEPGLRALATAAEVPYKSVLHAAHSKVLSLLTHAERFRGGMVADARPEEAGAERVSGMYLNSVPFPYERTAATWGELAQQVFAREVELWPHRRYPMPAMRRPGGESHLIDVLFHYLDFHQVDTELIDIMASRDDSPNEFRLVVGTPVRGHLSIASRTRTLSRGRAKRLAALYTAVFADMARTGAEGDARGSYPDTYERAALAAPALPHSDTPADVLGAFEAQAARTPTAPALSFGSATLSSATHSSGTLSYAALDARAEAVAHRLRTLGAGPETRVAVLLDRGPDLVAALLGVWKAGAAQVPVDPCTPDARIAGAEFTLAVTERRHAARLGDIPLVVTEDLTDTPVPARPATVHDPDRLAYVLHTSGSTGTPKGVEISHRSLAHYLHWAVEQYAAAGTHGAPWFTSVGFDLGLPALYAPLMTGQTVRLLPQSYGPGEFGAELLKGAPYSFVGLTPGHLTLLEAQLTEAELGSLAALAVCAGDAYPAAQADRVAARIGAGGMVLAAEYGPTEATVAATALRVLPRHRSAPRPVAAPAGVRAGLQHADTLHAPERPRAPRTLVALGSPLPGVTLRLLDSALRPVPDGITGEVYLGGDGLARGYAGRPDLTAAAFLPDPYGLPGARLYRTGDLARRLPGGALEFLGRADDQVKIRGHRVEPGEAEAALAADPSVREALVAAVDAADGGKRLAAWVVPAEGHTVSVPALRERLRAVLPAAVIPATVTALPALPLGENGKRDRFALVARAATAADAPYEQPRTDTERRLAAVWAEVLGLEQVGVHDDFRDLGGDSLLVPPLLLAARRAGLPLDLATALRHHTVEHLAAALDVRTAHDPAQEG